MKIFKNYKSKKMLRKEIEDFRIENKRLEGMNEAFVLLMPISHVQERKIATISSSDWNVLRSEIVMEPDIPIEYAKRQVLRNLYYAIEGDVHFKTIDNNPCGKKLVASLAVLKSVENLIYS